MAEHLRWQDCQAGQSVADSNVLRQQLALVVQGQVLLRDESGADPMLFQAGDCVGAGVMDDLALQNCSLTAATASLLAWLKAEDLATLCTRHARLQLMASHLGGASPQRAAAPADKAADPHLGLMQTPVRRLLNRQPVTASPEISITQAAQLMSHERVSSLPLVKDGLLFGLVTDRDLRNRALAQGLDPSAPVIDIATVAPLTISIDAPGFDALLLMARHNIHHVPVMDGTRVAGMITATDVTEQHSTSAVYLAGDVHKQTTLPGLVAVAARVKTLQRTLAAAGASAYSTGRIVTAITDALTSRLLVLAEAELGPAPVDYAWVAAGSQARSEQAAKSDQDNCLVLADDYDEAAHGAYFKTLATRVNDGLDACGYVYCPGEMMARTDEWRQPQSRWAAYFRRWTDTPDPKALMLTCVFFDLRCIHGRSELLDALRQTVLQQTKGNRIFLSYMVGNALTHRPPLSLFGGLSTVKHGRLRDAIDLKHSGIVPIVDLARVYALAGGHAEVNTHERLMVAAQSKEISEQSAHDLRDALEFMATLRIHHQSAQMAAGQPADNILSLSELSNFERGQLRDAFGVVQTLQSVLAQRYR